MEPTIVTTSSGGISIAYDYSPYLERIASALETIAVSTSTLERVAVSLETIKTISTTTGFRSESPYDWVKPTEVYDWYNQNLSTLITNTSTIDKLVSNISTITNSLPKFL